MTPHNKWHYLISSPAFRRPKIISRNTAELESDLWDEISHFERNETSNEFS